MKKILVTTITTQGGVHQEIIKFVLYRRAQRAFLQLAANGETAEAMESVTRVAGPITGATGEKLALRMVEKLYRVRR